jgi:hypothetical protein
MFRFVFVILCLISAFTTNAFVPYHLCSTCSTRSTTTSTLLMQKKKKTAAARNRTKPKGFAGAIRDLHLNTFAYAGDIRPGKQSPQRVVFDERIVKPDYHADGVVSRRRMVWGCYACNRHL